MNLNKLQKETYYAFGEIYTEEEAAAIGGNSVANSTSSPNEGCTKTRAIVLGCDVAPGYSDYELVAKPDLSKAITQIHILEIHLDVPSSVFGTNTTWMTSLGYGGTGPQGILVDPPVILGAGSSVSANASGDDYSASAYGTVPEDILEGNYYMFVDFINGQISFYSL